MRKLVIGILAHVDAGKTTLAESMLYLTGSIRKLGRVDHRDTFLDTYELERTRGITIFSKQAVFTYKDMEVTLLDTPGHVDFSAEMERTLQVLDYAILVISGSEGIQGHTETLWGLLARYKIPTFLFINKMDMEGTDREALMGELKKRLSESCIDFGQGRQDEDFMEGLAMCDEALLESYLEHGKIDAEDIRNLIAARKVFPCFFGSALRVEGVDAFLDGMEYYTKEPSYPELFGAKIYKIGRDEQGKRLTYMKITGGSLKVKQLLSNNMNRLDGSLVMDKKDEELTGSAEDSKIKASVGRSKNDPEEGDGWVEKVDQIRIYSGARYEAVEEVRAGTVCAVAGLTRTYAGEGLGIEAVSDIPLLQPVLSCQLLLPPDCNPHSLLSKLRQLEEEEPQLHVFWSDRLKELHVQLMGEVQTEVLKSLILDRFGVKVEIGTGNIVYKETILEPVEGVGHFEPLRHYAEVHLLLEPLEAGSGLEFASSCSEDELERSVQQAVLTHLAEKEHVGVLTGSSITDMRITLIAGRAHQKHTEGGDFRQATYRAVRQGLMSARSILLEPYYKFRLEVPLHALGRAMTDLNRMSGNFQPPEIFEETAVLTGQAPVATMRGYHTELADYTGGRGRLHCIMVGYLPCHNEEEVISRIGYDSERDVENPADSVFCSHGAGFVVPWHQVRNFMHVDSGWRGLKTEEDSEKLIEPGKEQDKAAKEYRGASKASFAGKAGEKSGDSWQADKELEEIFVRTFGPIRHKTSPSGNRLGYEKVPSGKAGAGGKTSLGETPGDEKASAGKTQGYERNLPGNGDGRWKKAPERWEAVKEYLLVDGYNIIFSWEELKELAMENMDAARHKLMDLLCNYQGFKKCILILVFDAYKVKGNVGEIQEYHNIHVVYTKEAETADEYIEKVTHELAGRHHVTVATSDALEQMIILGQGAVRLSAADLKEEILRTNNQIRRDYLDRQPSGRTYIGDHLREELSEFIEEDNKS
jgi:small GTP-binding protein